MSLYRTTALLATGLLISALTCDGAYSIPTEGLIGYWSGDGTAADASPTGNHGSFGGSYASGAPTGGKAFNLGSAKVIIPHHAAYNYTSYAGWSVGFWFSGNGNPIYADNGLFLGQDNGSGYQPKWFIDYSYTVFGNNSSFNFHVNDFNRERIFVGSDAVSAPVGWNQLTVTINNTNSGTVSFYLNGQAIGTAAMGSYVLATTAPLIFGQAESFSFNGLMSDVAIYNRVLSPAEAQQLATVSPDLPFSITSQSLDGSGNLVITWQSIPGRMYRVVGASALASPTIWTNVTSAILATNIITSAVVPIESSVSFLAVTRP